MIWYLIASLSPVVVILAAILFGGIWPLIALIWVTILVFILDRMWSGMLAPRPDARSQVWARRISLGLALIHLLLLPVAVWALVAHPDLSFGQSIALFFAVGIYFGQVANSNAHELIHSRDHTCRCFGIAVFVVLLFGHHNSAHRLVHHVWAATDNDPNSARRGEGFYAFWRRAWVGSFMRGWQAENQLRRRKHVPPPYWSHPYFAYVGGAILTLGAAWLLAGPAGALTWVGLSIYAQMQLFLADYVQHYGLRRLELAEGKLQPVGPQHAWNAAQWYSSAMMLNAPRHSDHHQHPARSFAALRITRATMPLLPRSLPVMAALALVPPLWRRVMDPRLDGLPAQTR